jgi:hypothetical protein
MMVALLANRQWLGERKWQCLGLRFQKGVNVITWMH